MWRFLCSILQRSQIKESNSTFETCFNCIKSTLDFIPMIVVFLKQIRSRHSMSSYMYSIYKICIRFTFPSWNLHSKISASICSWRVWRLYQGWSLIRSQKIAKNGENWPPWSFGHDSQLRVSHCFVAATIQLTFLREKKEAKIRVKSLLRRRKKWKEEGYSSMIAKILHIITKLNYHLLQKKTKEVLVCSTASPPFARVCAKNLLCM